MSKPTAIISLMKLTKNAEKDAETLAMNALNSSKNFFMTVSPFIE